MWSKLNPVPKFIIIFAAIGAIAYGVSKSDVLTSKIDSAVKSAGMPVPAPQSAPAAARVSTPAPVAVQGFDSYDRISRLHEIRIGVQGNAAPFYAAGRGFNVDYLALLTRQPIGEQVRDQQEPISQSERVVILGRQLVQRVERQEL